MPGRRNRLTPTTRTVTGRHAVTDSERLYVQALGLALRSGRELVTDVSFHAGPGSVTAIIGPSGAGKSTVAKLVGGVLNPTSGQVHFGGHDIHTEYASVRHRIGLVPQDDVVHHQLTVAEALRYAAELRLPDATRRQRGSAVRRVLRELELTGHADTRVDQLSGGQRKRASVAMELLTEPALLILDEPTSGLDPALDRQVMTMLRRLADAGRIVLVVTHCLTYLDMCDQVLLMTARGRTAYCGSPEEVSDAMGTANWADIFTKVATHPDEANREFVARGRIDAPSVSPAGWGAASSLPRVRCPLRRQVSTIMRRQLRLVVADRGYFAFLAILPFILGTLSLLVPGDVGLGIANLRGSHPNEPAQIMILANISAVFMGMALTIRDLVGERSIFRREQAAGVSASAYLFAKIMMSGAIVAVQTAVLTAIVVGGKGAPTRGAVVIGSPMVEFYLTLAMTGMIAAIMGLAMSATARSQDQILPMLVVGVMLSIVLSGGLIPVTGRMGLDQVSWLIPARWGFAASASTVDLRAIAPLTPSSETLWAHDLSSWLLNMAVLAALGAIMAAWVRLRIRLNAASLTSDCAAVCRVGAQLWRVVGGRREAKVGRGIGLEADGGPVARPGARRGARSRGVRPCPATGYVRPLPATAGRRLVHRGDARALSSAPAAQVRPAAA